MFIKELNLNVDYESCGMTRPEKEPTFTGYILKNSDEYCKDRKRPAVIVCPGGGYAFTSDREATPIATAYLAAGISAFVLRYSVTPSVFPAALVELATAVKMVRSHADEWNINPDKIIVVGFSAGGHLAGSLGVFWNSPVLRECGFTDDVHKPNAMVLSYPVISGVNHPHEDSFRYLLGSQTPTEEQLRALSLELHVSKDTPPAFIWHTFTDTCVPVQNSLIFASALTEHQIPMEMHIYPEGIHGLSLGNITVNTPENVMEKVQGWVRFSTDWIDQL